MSMSPLPAGIRKKATPNTRVCIGKLDPETSEIIYNKRQDVIEQFTHPHSASVIGEVTKKQQELYKKLGVEGIS